MGSEMCIRDRPSTVHAQPITTSQLTPYQSQFTPNQSQLRNSRPINQNFRPINQNSRPANHNSCPTNQKLRPTDQKHTQPIIIQTARQTHRLPLGVFGCGGGLLPLGVCECGGSLLQRSRRSYIEGALWGRPRQHRRRCLSESCHICRLLSAPHIENRAQRPSEQEKQGKGSVRCVRRLASWLVDWLPIG